MTSIEKDHAQELICPFMQESDVWIKCQAGKCISWEFDSNDSLLGYCLRLDPNRKLVSIIEKILTQINNNPFGQNLTQ